MVEASSKLKRLSFEILVLVVINIAAHYSKVPFWVIALSLTLVAWRLLVHQGTLKFPGKFTVMLINLVSLGGIFVHFGSILGYEQATAFLVLAAGAKILEMQHYRDQMVAILLCFYLILVKVLVSQDFVTFAFVVADIVAAAALLMRMHSKEPLSQAFKVSGRGFLKALPLMLILFLVFPRIGTGFWPLQDRDSTVGFSDFIDPGRVAKMAQSDKVAFRAEFRGGIVPPMEHRYWRGAVLWISDGLRWKRLENSPSQSDLIKRIDVSSYEHQVILEPRFGRWLFSFDTPTHLWFADIRKQAQISKRQGRIYQTERESGYRLIYKASSILQPVSESLSSIEQRMYLQMPPLLSQRAKDLIETLNSSDKTSTKAKATAVLQYFADSGFRYTLEPGKTASLDEFLFEKRVGFCEHFAAAFGVLMRGMGVPTRMVVGFHGGEFNQFDGFLTVRDRDAHAWAEIWAEESQRWLRYDPTSVVAEVRLALGGQRYSTLDPEQLAAAGGRRGFWGQESWLADLVRRFDHGIEALSNQWNFLLLSYDYDLQRDLFSLSGLKFDQFTLFGTAMLCLATFGFWYWRQQHGGRVKLAKEVKLYTRIQKRARKAGVPWEPWEGPATFLQRCSQSFPEYQEAFNQFADLYQKMHYGSLRGQHDIKTLRTVARRIGRLQQGRPRG